MRRLSPTTVAVLAGILALLLILYVFSDGKRENPERLDADEVAGVTERPSADECGSQQTFDLVKREAFRRAAELRGSNQAEFDHLAAYSVARVTSPTSASADEAAGPIRCSGTLAIDLPPGVVSADGQRTVGGDIGYTVQSAASSGQPAVALSNANAIVVALASLQGSQNAQAGELAASTDGEDRASPAPAAQPARRPSSSPPPAPNPAPRRAEREPAPRRAAPAPAPEPRAAPAPQPTATASPSFNCRNARARSEIAVCRNAALASLDRQMASQFYSARSRATPQQRALLERTRGTFLGYRNRCRNTDCIAAAYRDRMREISDIMAGRWNP